MTKLNSSNLLTPLAVVVVGIMISGSILWSVQRVLDEARLAYGTQVPASQSAASPPPSLPTVDVAKVSIKGVPFIGSANAPVVMAYWYDYQCPFCRQVEETVMPKLMTDYVQTGKLRILFKDFAFLGADSQTAGLAARAVWEIAPDKFYEWHKAMFDHQDRENAGWGNKDDILALTKTISGIDATKVEQLMTDRAADYESAIRADGNEGASMGISGTPGIIIGKQLIIGAEPFEIFKAAIETTLSSR